MAEASQVGFGMLSLSASMKLKLAVTEECHVAEVLLLSNISLGGAFGPERNYNFSDADAKAPQFARLGNRLRACPRNYLTLGRQR